MLAPTADVFFSVSLAGTFRFLQIQGGLAMQPLQQASWNFGHVVGLTLTLLVVFGAPILWLSRHAIGRLMNDRAGRKAAQTNEADSATFWKSTNDENGKERSRQLSALADAVPATPPARMRATIHLNCFKSPHTEVRYYEGYPAKLQRGLNTIYSVDMILEFSEEERGLIVQHNLHTIILEDKPKYTKEELADMRYSSAAAVNSVSSPLTKSGLVDSV